jgi:transposase
MELLHARCAGLDVHQKTVVACARLADGDGVHKDVATFDTTTQGLLVLSDWLQEHGVTHVVMESTGVYWKPVWHVLEGEFDVALANAKHVRNVPGRKTDVNDATWLAELLAHGLIRASFVPPTSIQDMRDLTRTRKQLVRERARHVQRIQKTLEDANIKLTSVISDVMGQSGRAVLDALVSGETDPEKLVDLMSKRLKAPREQLVEALRGRVRNHHRFVIRLHLQQADALASAVADLEGRLGEQLDPFREPAALLETIPGISATAAQILIAEMGADMSRFATADHLVSWAGLCPRSDESAGKRRSTRIRKGAPWLKTVLVQCAWAAIRVKDGYLRNMFHRIKSRRGPMKAIIAVAAAILRSAHAMLTRNEPYADLGTDHFTKRERAKSINRLLRRLDALGIKVTRFEDQTARLVSS